MDDNQSVKDDRAVKDEESCESNKKDDQVKSGKKETTDQGQGGTFFPGNVNMQGNPAYYPHLYPNTMMWPHFYPGYPNPAPHPASFAPAGYPPPYAPPYYQAPQPAPDMGKRGSTPAGKPDTHTAESSISHDDCGCSEHETSTGPEHLKHDENKFGQMFGIVNDIAKGQADPSQIISMLEGFDGHFWKGAIVGVAATLLLGSDAVKGAIAGVFSGLAGKEASSAEKPEVDNKQE